MKRTKALRIRQKLQLTRTTIRSVSDEVLSDVEGGYDYMPMSRDCTGGCCGGGYTKL